jgi:radical SAM superfamily enzyme YgiQ (UPF0313 family)
MVGIEYLKIESGSLKVLDFYNSIYNINDAKSDIILCRKLGFVTIGLFMVGAPIETKDDLQDTIQLAINFEYDYIPLFSSRYIQT